MVEEITQEWNEGYNKLLEHVKKRGNNLRGGLFSVDLGLRYSKDGAFLEKWIAEQRQAKDLSTDQILKLENLPGWTWDEIWSVEQDTIKREHDLLRRKLSDRHLDIVKRNELELNFEIKQDTIRGRLIKAANQLREIAQQCWCGEVFCTTCGGQGHYLNRKIPHTLKEQLKVLLRLADIETISSICHPYDHIVFGLDRDRHIQSELEYGERMLNRVRSRRTDIFVEQYLLDRKHYRDSKHEKLKEIWNKVLTLCTYQAERSLSDESLIETVIILQKKNIIRFPNILKYGLDKAKNDKHWKRVMYNSTREISKEIRSFYGDQMGDIFK